MIKATEKETFLCKNVVSPKQPCNKCLLMSSHMYQFFTVARTVRNRCLAWDLFTWDTVLRHWVICAWYFETTASSRCQAPIIQRHSTTSQENGASNGIAAKAEKLTSISRIFRANMYKKW